MLSQYGQIIEDLYEEVEKKPKVRSLNNVCYRMQIVQLYMMYYTEWKVDRALKKDRSHFVFDRVSIKTIFTRGDAPMELIEFKMWAEQSYAHIY